MCVRLFGCHAFVSCYTTNISHFANVFHIDVLSLKYHVLEPAFCPSSSFSLSLALPLSSSMWVVVPFVSPQQSQRQFFLFTSHSLHSSVCMNAALRFSLSGFFPLHSTNHFRHFLWVALRLNTAFLLLLLLPYLILSILFPSAMPWKMNGPFLFPADFSIPFLFIYV